jgi:hypothetical protein
MTSIPLIEQLLLAGPTCRGPAQCKHSPWTIKGRVHSLEHEGQIHKHKSRLSSTQGSHSQYNTIVDVGYYAPVARTTLKSSCPSCVHLSTDRAPLKPILN